VARLEDFKTATKAYVADYRTLVSPGQKSFSETYGVITGARPRRPAPQPAAERVERGCSYTFFHFLSLAQCCASAVRSSARADARGAARAAVLGHFTTFGVGKRPLPEKLKTKERGRLAAAEKALAREMQRDTSEFTPV